MTTPKDLALSTAAQFMDEKYHPRHKQTCCATTDALRIGTVICSNGALHHKIYCAGCNAKGGAISNASLAGIDVSGAKIIASHDVHPCERCGSEDGSEVHHWAPVHLFSDAHAWPTSRLCRACHMEWHAVVTPSMRIHDNTPQRTAA